MGTARKTYKHLVQQMRQLQRQLKNLENQTMGIENDVNVLKWLRRRSRRKRPPGAPLANNTCITPRDHR